MKLALAVLLAVHALIHLMGFLEAFGFAAVAKLTLPITRPLGVVWLIASLTLLGALGALFVAPRAFWLLAALGVAISQLVIVSSWGDAKFGTVANVVLLAAALYAAYAWGPFGLRAAYQRELRSRLVRTAAGPLVTEADLAVLPAPVRRYLHFTGAVGKPRIRNFRVRFAGRIRSAANAPWMEFSAEQYSFIDRPARLFMMGATMKGFPVDVFHSYVESSARMRVKVLSVYPMIDASGRDFTRAETVTLFNDMCVMAPATLIDPAIKWKVIDDTTVEGSYTNSGFTISAALHFDASGALVDFTSDDRPALAPDGKTFVSQRWSTPLTGYRAHGTARLASHGETRYAARSGEYAYGEFDMQDVTYNLAP